jgi:hypothetical protein
LLIEAFLLPESGILNPNFPGETWLSLVSHLKTVVAEVFGRDLVA